MPQCMAWSLQRDSIRLIASEKEKWITLMYFILPALAGIQRELRKEKDKAMYKITQSTVTVEQIELRSMPFEQWPEEAKQSARAILTNKAKQRDLYETLPGLRKDRLVSFIEQEQYILEQFSKAFGITVI